VIGPLVALFIWLFVGLDEATARRGDAALARDAARELAGRNRVLLAGRLARDPRTNGVRIAIATDQDVRVVRRPRRQRWGQMWCVPYTDITSFSSDEKAEPCHVTLDVGDRRLKVEYRWRLGEGRGDYQREQRKALLAILERRTGAVAGEAEDGLGIREPRTGAAQLGE